MYGKLALVKIHVSFRLQWDHWAIAPTAVLVLLLRLLFGGPCLPIVTFIDHPLLVFLAVTLRILLFIVREVAPPRLERRSGATIAQRSYA